jgi:hypothetical protein
MGILRVQDGTLGVQENCEQWKSRIFIRKTDDIRQPWRSHVSADLSHDKPMMGISGHDDASHRKRGQEASVLRPVIDNGKETKDKNHSSGHDSGHRGKIPISVQEVINHYITLQGKTLSEHQVSAFYRRFSKSAKALLEVCCQNVQEAKDAITKLVNTTDRIPASGFRGSPQGAEGSRKVIPNL